MSEKFYNGRFWPHSPSELPPGTYYMILEFSQTYVEGDQRSRDCPGHGYGPHTEQHTDCIVYENKEEWEKEIKNRMVSTYYGSKSWVPLVAQVPKIETTVTTKIG